MPRLLESLLSARRSDRSGLNGNGHTPTRSRADNVAHAKRRSSYVITAAEAARCTCPDFCERDHAND